MQVNRRESGLFHGEFAGTGHEDRIPGSGLGRDVAVATGGPLDADGTPNRTTGKYGIFFLARNVGY
jgi:hypothetical protein